jgi:hypothetical protein
VTVTSPTGQFNSNSTTWNPATTFTMSKNTGNKNFYYKDSAVGTYTIGATLTTRTTGKSWTASQIINIGVGQVLGTSTDNLPDTNSTGTSTATSTATTTTTEDYSSNNVTIVSTHYIEEDLSSYIEPTVFNLSAGRKRLSYIGTPVSLEAKHKLSTDLQSQNCNYLWTFGDGASSAGEKIEHIYKYAGDYNLVLNGNCGSTQSVSRTVIEVAEPKLTLSAVSDGSIAIMNNSKYEINLYAWKLSSPSQMYAFPLDTIIGANQKVIFPAEYTKISNVENVSLLDATGKSIALLANTMPLINGASISPAELVRFLESYKKLTNPQI